MKNKIVEDIVRNNYCFRKLEIEFKIIVIYYIKFCVYLKIIN